MKITAITVAETTPSNRMRRDFQFRLLLNFIRKPLPKETSKSKPKSFQLLESAKPRIAQMM